VSTARTGPATPRLVATDLDGTVVRDDGTISRRTVAAFARAERAGALIVVVTGRPPRAMTEIAGAFGHQGTAIVANGAMTYDMRTGEVTATELIAPGPLAMAVSRLRAAVPGIGIAVEYPDGRAIDRVFQPVMFDVANPGPRSDDATLTARPAAKLLGRHLGYGCDELLAVAGPALDGLVDVTHSSASGLIEAAAPGVSKASAVARVAASAGIPRDSAIAFGDQPNDLPLLAWAGVSCAVDNAHPRVLAAATRIIGGNNEDGVASVLESLYPLAPPRPPGVDEVAWGTPAGRQGGGLRAVRRRGQGGHDRGRQDSSEASGSARASVVGSGGRRCLGGLLISGDACGGWLARTKDPRSGPSGVTGVGIAWSGVTWSGVTWSGIAGNRSRRWRARNRKKDSNVPAVVDMLLSP
jgi:HAD superfamily hydrolase (TIGR01484 family)